MAESEEQSATIPWLSLITLICISTGIIFFFPQLTSSRPGGGDSTLLTKRFGDETVNARLWQDPLGVAIEDGESVGEDGQKKKYNFPHSITRFQELFIAKCTNRQNPEIWHSLERQLPDLTRYPEGVQILAVMIPGGPYVEDVERRLRSRRAVLEALGSGWRSRGFDPEKEHEIGYFSVPWPGYGPTTTLSAHSVEKSRSKNYRVFDQHKRPLSRHITEGAIMPVRRLTPYQLRTDTRRSLLIPFEWCEAEYPETQPSQVLILWLNDEEFVDAPIARLADLISWFQLRLINTTGHANLYLPSLTVLGPDNSGTLHQMLVETNEHPWSKETAKYLATTHILSSQASAAEQQLFSDIPFPLHTGLPAPILLNHISTFQRDSKALLEGAINNLDADSNFTFDRTNLSDNKIVEAIRRELPHQHVMPGEKVVLISEEDTYYARALFASFIDANSKSNDPFQISAYTYLRGIDGKLPVDQKEKGDRTQDERSDNATQTSYKTPPQTRRPAEQTEGLNQADDIVRLAEELKSDDKTSKIKAIGLLGSDVYDKLEILKALRPYFPDAVVFTNHLDARFSHPDEWKETHNLIIATDFTLHIPKPGEASPKSADQKVGPFRDAGQTALYEATLEAIGGIISTSQTRPSSVTILEIGRDGPIQLGIASDILKSLDLARIIFGAGLLGVLLLFMWWISRVKVTS